MVSPLCRALSVDLYSEGTPKDLMTKFVACLIRLPNLRTLEIFRTNDAKAVTKGLERKSARFPGIRQLGICDSAARFVGNCPNVETITALPQLSLEGVTILCSYAGKSRKLKRVVGIVEDCVLSGEVKVML